MRVMFCLLEVDIILADKVTVGMDHRCCVRDARVITKWRVACRGEGWIEDREGYTESQVSEPWWYNSVRDVVLKAVSHRE